MYSINAFTQTYWHGNQGMKIVQCCLVQCDITSTLDMTLLPPIPVLYECDSSSIYLLLPHKYHRTLATPSLQI